MRSDDCIIKQVEIANIKEGIETAFANALAVLVVCIPSESEPNLKLKQ